MHVLVFFRPLLVPLTTSEPTVDSSAEIVYSALLCTPCPLSLSKLACFPKDIPKVCTTRAPCANRSKKLSKGLMLTFNPAVHVVHQETPGSC